MGINSSFDISTSGINAERMHMELIASNLANINSTKTADGGDYHRKIAVYSENEVPFSEFLEKEQMKKAGTPGGVNLEVMDDSSPMQRVYNPGHPDADEKGYVAMPNVSMAKEMADLVYTSKMYEANITVFNATKKMVQDTLQLQ